MTRRVLHHLTLAYLLTTLTHGENPAIKVILTDKGLQYVKEIGTEWIRENLQSVSPPDVHDQISTYLGTVYVSAIGMEVTGYDLPEPYVGFYDNVRGFKASISGLDIEIRGDWSASYGIIKDSGMFDLTVLDVEVMTLVSLGMDPDGQPSVSLSACEASVGSTSLDLIDASWIIKQFVDDNLIRQKIQDKICPTIQDRFDALQYRLEEIGATFQVNQLLAVDVPFTNYPEVDYSSLRMSLKGTFHSSENPEEPPFEAQPFSLAGEPGHMMSLGLSEYTTNSAAYAYFIMGQLQANITDNMVPSSSPLRLNTKSFGIFIPELPKRYPDMEMELHVYAREAPELSFKSGVVTTDLLGAIRGFVVTPDGSSIALFLLNVDSNFTGKFRTANDKLTGSVSMDNFTMTLAASDVGPIKTAALGKLMEFGIKLAGLLKLNAKLAKGIDVPTMQHAKLTNLVMEVEEGFISVLSDAEFL